MKSKAKFYHAGCPVCVDAEQMILNTIDKERYDVEVVHLGDQKGRVPEAETAGVRSVPALTVDDQVYHINFGADINDLK